MTIDAQGFFWFGSPLVAALVAALALGTLALSHLGLTGAEPAPGQAKPLPATARVRSRAALPLPAAATVGCRAALPRSTRTVRVPQARPAAERQSRQDLASCGTRRVA